MRLYGRGIRRRPAPMLGNRAQLEMAHSAMFSLPGTPVLRYGDELGMGEDLSLPERQAVRTPMQWSNEPHAGFSRAEEVIHPVVSEGPYSYKKVNVEAQRREPNSLLNWTAQMIRLRKECPEIGWGDWTLLDAHAPGVLAMRYDWRGNSVICLHNFSDQPREVRIRPGVERGERLVNLRVEDESGTGEDGAHRLRLEGYDYRWYRVGGLTHLLQRRRV